MFLTWDKILQAQAHIFQQEGTNKIKLRSALLDSEQIEIGSDWIEPRADSSLKEFYFPNADKARLAVIQDSEKMPTKITVIFDNLH